MFALGFLHELCLQAVEALGSPVSVEMLSQKARTMGLENHNVATAHEVI